MFNFMKKSTVLAGGDSIGSEERDGDKEKRKREKKERKEREKRERIAAGLEEPLRLEEVRRSLKLRGRRKEKEKLPSGITADYTASLFAHLEQDSNYTNYPFIPTSGSNSNLSDENNHLSPGYPTTHTWHKKDSILQSDSSETSLNSLNNPNNANTSPRQPPNLPPVPPRPPKRGILKGTRLSNTSSNSQESNVQSTDIVDFVNGQDSNVLARNTQQNEVISYGITGSKSTSSSDDMQQLQNFTKKVIHSPVETQYKNSKATSNNPLIVTQDVDEMPKTNGNSYIGVTSTSPSADSLTDTTTNSSFATPPFSTSPVGESQGFHRWSRTSNFDDVYLPLPPLTPLQLPKSRVLTIQRQKSPRSDFGFSLRRAMIQERVFIGNLNGHEENGLTNGDSKFNGNITNGLISKLTYKAVILAEPGSYPGASETGLLPGDRLLEVNGVNVEGKSREEVIDLIKGSQDSVTVKVQPIAELCELSRRRAADGGGDVLLSDSNVRGGTLSRSGSRRFTSTQAKSEEQLACEKEWLQAGHMWLAHRSGFTAVVREGDADAGRVRVRVLKTGETLTVDEDDLEKANPPQMERCEDIASLRCLNECGALHVLRARHAAGLPHARAGHALLVLGPPRRTAPIYTDKVAAMFRGCRADDMPPHVFAAAQSAHRCMLASRRDRAIVFLGRSGSGKTSAMRYCVWYLASAYPAQGSKLTPEKFDAAFDVLHTFGSCRTSSNQHASRFVSLTSLDFDGGGALVSASVQTLLPDLKPGQAPLRAIHNLFHGCDGRVRRELLLDQSPVNAPNPFISCNEKADAPTEFAALKEAMQLLGVTEQEQLAVWKILAAICHLGWAGVVKGASGSGLKYQFGSSACGQRAARLLGAPPDELARALFGAAPSSPHHHPALRTPSPSNEREISGTEALDAFVTGLYNETFNIISAFVNRSLSTSSRTAASVLLLDAPGADNPMCAGQQSGASLSKLLSNYLQERLQAVFHEAMLVAPRERYAQEGIALDDGSEEDWISETVNPGPMVELLDKSPQNTIVRSSQADLRECDRRGLLWLLDEESMYPGSSDDTFLERVMTHYGAPNHTQYLIKKAPHARQFLLQHLQGTNPVLYDVSGWVKASRESPVTKKALTLLQESQNEEIVRLSCWVRGSSGGGPWATGAGDVGTLRRASSIRRTLTSGAAGMKRRSTALQAKFVADGVVDSLRRCGSGGVQFVCCLLTNQPSEGSEDVNVPLLRSQFRGFQLLDAARLYKQGFPEHMPLSEFARRYRLLATSESESEENNQSTLSDRQIVDDMLLALDLDVTSYRLGLTQEDISLLESSQKPRLAAPAHARRPPRRARASTPRDRDRPRGSRAMPAVKVFNIFGGQKPTDKHQNSSPAQNSPMQKFYRTFSVPPQNITEKNSSKVNAIAACLEKKISEPILNKDNVLKFPKNNSSVSSVLGKSDVLKTQQHVYENVNINSANTNVQRDQLLDETKGYSSIYENIVIVGKSPNSKNNIKANAESKLNKALESFDKILSEFSLSTSLITDLDSTKHTFIVPKLQKSKTCSIIESRCILKKSNSDPENDIKSRNRVSRNNSIDKTTSLWNLDDMKSKELSSPLVPLTSVNEKMNPDKYATYKISSKNSTRMNCIKTEELKKLDVKTRILKKTLSNPPSTPIPVVTKTKALTKKVEKKGCDQKKAKLKSSTVNEQLNINTSLEPPRSQMQKAKSVWEIGNEMIISPNLERTRSTTSIAGSPSKIPVIRSQMSHNKFSSTRALFSPTPLDLNNIDQARECAQKKKPTIIKKTVEKSDIYKQVRQKSLICLKTDLKRQVDKTKKDTADNKKITLPLKPTPRDYSEEIDAVRAKIQQRKINKRDIVLIPSETKRNENGSDEIDSNLTPVKSIVKKIELKTAMESKTEMAQFVSCKVIPAVHKEVCVANTTFHNHLSTLVGRQVKYVESRDDIKTCSQDKKLELQKHADEKISDTHSDCSDDSGHVSNDAANDNDPSFDAVHDLVPVNDSIDEVICKLFDGPKKFGIDLSKNAKSVCPVRPARRNARSIEVDSGTRSTAAPKVDEQIMFRGGVVGGLDSRRDAALARVLVRLQARARGLLARRRARTLRTQHTAARCVQRNVRAFLAVRDWPWWRLLVRVTPLLAVHRIEHRLKQAQDELETLRVKLEKVEGERSHYKNETEKLESKLSEVGGELAEERAAAGLAAERADAEAAERLRVERDNRELLGNNQRLQQASERLELELLHWRSAESGGAEPSDSEGSEADVNGTGEKYKRRFESAHREVQLLRAQLRRQHEDDLEQLVTVKKQLEKKVQDAYEEVEEQRAVAAQWKRKLQKLTNDMADLRSLLDEQTCRNNLLEKRQRKFDAELHGAQEELKRERAAKERLSRERDQAHAEKYALEQSLSEARLELELKEERLAAAARELEERGGGDELSALRKARADLERRLRDQDEELDDLAGQIQLLESSKLRLEMLLEQQRKEARLEAAARDEEMEETRANASKKLKILESQLESEHSERSLLLRERHELERRLAALEEAARVENQEQAQLLQRLKRDLKRYRALLRDAQTMLEQKEKEGGGKAQIRQLKNQVEDLELSLRASTKAKQAAEAEAAEAIAALEEATRAKNEATERALAANRDAAAARAHADDVDEEAAELLKKYRASASALCAAQAEAREAGARADAAGEQARAASDRLAELSARLAAATGRPHHDAERRLDARNKELESSLELEATARSRLEGQLSRLREAHEQLSGELATARSKELQAVDELRKQARILRELKEENSNLMAKLGECSRAKAAAESAASTAVAEAAAARDEARLAARRAAALQEAIAGDLSSPGDSRDTDSDNDSYSSDESIGTFLANHKLSPAAPSRSSMHLDSQKSQTSEGRQSRISSSGGSKPASPTKESFA